MHILVLLMIFAVMTFPYLASKGWLPIAALIYTPEILSLLVALYVIVLGIEQRFKNVSPLYWFVFVGLALGLIAGAVVNQLEPGPMFAGIRAHLRALPLFFLPAVLVISEKHIRTQVVLILALCLVQLPLFWQQRMATEAIAAQRGLLGTTGDNTFGTLMNSGLSSVFLIGAACVLTGFYLKQRIPGRWYIALLIWILMPTTLNETKITLFLLPFALLATFYAGSAPGARLKNTAFGLVLIIGFLAIFVPIYDHFMVPRWGYGIIDFLLMEGRIEGYLVKGAQVGDTVPAGRLDGITATFAEISRDPARMVFGLGIGNASDSALGDQFNGAYYRMFEHFRLNSLNFITLEHGLLGIALVLLLHWLIFLDSLELARRGFGTLNAIAVGWVGVSVVIVCSLVYHTPIFSQAISFLYWYFSGIVVAQLWRLKIQDLPKDGGITKRVHG